jgi:hypothetical protein
MYRFAIFDFRANVDPVPGRAPVLATAALACALVGGFPVAATADVGPAGFGISDDVHIPSISLDETFDELQPKSFRRPDR